VPVWKATVLLAGIISFAMVVGSSIATTHGLPRKIMLAFAAVKLVVYEAWMLSHDDYLYVIVDTRRCARHRRRAAPLAVDARGSSRLARRCRVQASGFDLHPASEPQRSVSPRPDRRMILFYRGVTKERDDLEQPVASTGLWR